MTAKEIMYELSSFLAPIHIKAKNGHTLIIHVSGAIVHINCLSQKYFTFIMYIKYNILLLNISS